MSTRVLSRAVAALALAGAALGASAADLVFGGNLVYDTDVVRIDFTLAAPGNVTLWTDSWRAGLNFDPTLALFDGATQLLTVGDDTPDPAALRPGQGGYDSTITLAGLAAGRYLLALTASGNDALGPRFVDGFSLQGTTPIPIALWNQPSYDINTNNQKGGAWRVHVDGVTTAVVAVPEPSTWALMVLGFLAIAGRVLRLGRSGAERDA